MGLELVNLDTGEIGPDAPPYSEALSLLARLQTQVEMLERDLQGKRLRIATLETERELQMLDDPLRPEVELIWAVWKQACSKRRPLHYTDRENIAAALRQLGLDTCLRAIAGACYDPHTRRLRNGRTQRYQDLELIFRSYGKVVDFADRAPQTWQPDPERIARIANVSVDWINQKLG